MQSGNIEFGVMKLSLIIIIIEKNVINIALKSEMSKLLLDNFFFTNDLVILR